MMARARKDDTLLWITRMQDDGTDVTVCYVGYRGNAGRGVFNHAKRLPQVSETWPPSPGALLVTLLINGGQDSSDDDPLVVRPESAEWFVGTWLNVPKRWSEAPAAGPREE